MEAFTAIDVETANPDMASICQIGVVAYNDETLIDEWVTLINPEDWFDPVNASIHGITEQDVKDAPSLPDVWDHLLSYLENRVSVCHTHFDRVAIARACEEHSLPYPTTQWLDTARVARRAWPQFAQRGYGLHNVSTYLGYTYREHDALEDARAAANVLIEAMRQNDMGVSDWLTRVERPIDPRARERLSLEGNPDGPLYGEVLAFTGALSTPRTEAAAVAAELGCTVSSGVTKRTTMLVVGDQDIRKLAGATKSNKHRKAESLISAGQEIRILKESDFLALVEART